MTLSLTESDVLIVGGGMAGGLMAAALMHSGLSVVVLDAAPVPQMPAGAATPRVSALTEASRHMLENVGAWQQLPPARIQPYDRMHVWDGDGTGDVRFAAQDLHTDALGWIVENEALVAALYQVVTASRVQWQPNARTECIRRSEQGWRVTLADGREYCAPMLIGADGARSAVRQVAGIPGTGRDTGHVAIVGSAMTALPHGACARQRFIDSGPLALLPLFTGERGEPEARHQVSIVWSLWPAEAERLMALDDAAFDIALTQASTGCLGDMQFQGRRFVFPIQELHASSYISEGLALIGDAAHVVHPLAGQGINLGLLDAAVLAEEMLRARQRGLPHCHASALQRYERRRRGHNALMLNAMHGFKVLFEASAPPVRLVRNMGMNLVNRLLPARNLFARQAMGRGGDLPQLARSKVS
ncbi:UbiH/UbiF/VisC/COQ6 family ubiquinone biosynthesis hydroxylase [Alcanivorax sp. JB21]|uniref:UbiH/UbiF/VisC/COQ6 family ubiquinone biosynthesis hydroxylase n=1 Tax=Alcanivorax limicola TaxID=2874102 RepID=UPI001CC10EE5|nr:UbiH/UbiF/VisC/COQ6 family ubiquinone biosynthesis hydroxylase [Alcanivorax limicola]MBZ2189160.1 UbiH/UbiF/VisC/COQ6 family ubiquinone biosynthesis hydroxylase [Alcanivorax limicola]